MAKAEIEISSSGSRRLIRQLDKIEKNMKDIGKASKKTTKQAARGFSSLKGTIGRFGAVLGAVAIGQKAKEVLDLNKMFGVLQVKMGMTTKQITDLKNSSLDQGAAIGWSRDQMAEYLGVLQDQGGHVQAGIAGFGKMGRFAKSVGIQAETLGRALAGMYNKGYKNKEIVGIWGALNKQADMGTIATKSLAANMSLLSGAMSTAGFKGKGIEKEIGVMMQAIGTVEDRGDQARTVFETLFADIQNAVIKGKLVRKEGESGLQLAERISKLSTKQQVKLGLTKLALKATGGINKARKTGLLDKLKNVKSSSGDVDKSWERYSTGIASESLKTEQALAKFNAAIQKYGTSIIKFAVDSPGAAAGGAAGGYAAYKLLSKLVKSGVQKVFVMNQPSSTGYSGPFGKLGKSLNDKLGKMSKIGKVGVGAGALALGYGFGTLLDQTLGISDGLSSFAVSLGSANKEMRDSLSAGGKIQQGRAKDLSMQKFIGMAKKNVTLEGRDGKRVELTPEKIAEIVAGQQGISDPKQIELLQKIAEKELKVDVKPSSGMQKPKAKTAKGKQT